MFIMSLKKIVVYSMNPCPYCVTAKQLLKKRGVEFEEIMIDYFDEKMWNDLEIKSGGMKTVPQIYVDNKILGGLPELQKLDSQDNLLSLK